MSIKIYTAYRIPIDKINHFIKAMHKEQMKRVSIFVANYFDAYKKAYKYRVVNALKKSADSRNESLLAHQKQNQLNNTKLSKPKKPRSVNNLDILYLMWIDAIEAKKTSLRQTWDMEISWSVWTTNNEYAYCVPHGPYWSYEDRDNYGKLKLPKYAIPYGYWDNTDEDEDATKEEWAEREKVWMKMINEEDDNYSYRMSFWILDPNKDPRLNGYTKLVDYMVKNYPNLFSIKSTGDSFKDYFLRHQYMEWYRCLEDIPACHIY